MSMYEDRLLKFLKDNKKYRFTAKEIASFWKRSTDDVLIAAMALEHQRKVFISTEGYIRVK